ncbi:hypothetical protein PTTG_28318 [Puccinia triticina 1-1 BBBD Race 1]|uniref:Uncharacterized protein n=1 Tax=Puccinia triticina (isolate 1-1 / race 1 (BBBD)) TaxID=630390 RepID=A0A180GCP4_PUCT1|nr:hypothetical protein PTTG_28318 [Puccinia triticina 1-1 BBBD Race 1]
MEEDVSDSDETPQHQNIPPRQSTPRQQQPSGYGIHNTENRQEPMFQPQFQPKRNQAQAGQQQPLRPEPQKPDQQTGSAYYKAAYPPRPVIIKDLGLYYEGTQFMKFLNRFERTANAYGATNHDKAAQILRFIRKEQLKCQLEEMDGYNTYNWTKLQAEMVKAWGGWIIRSSKQQAKDGITNYWDYKLYVSKFTLVLSYLVKNKHINKNDDTGILFLSPFSIESQRSIKRTLVTKDQLPKAKDGSNKAPKWDDLLIAAETEVRVDKGYTNLSNFLQANRTMQKDLDIKKGDGKQQDQMLKETPNNKVVEQRIQDMQQ